MDNNREIEVEKVVFIRMTTRHAKELLAELDDIVTDYDGTAPVDGAKRFLRKLSEGLEKNAD